MDIIMLKSLLSILLIVLSLMIVDIYADVTNIEAIIAQNITEICDISSNKDIKNIIDKRYSVGTNYYENDYIKIDSVENIKAVYILWDKLPEQFSIKDSLGNLISEFDSSNNIILHQVIKIKADTKTISLSIEKGNCKIAEIYVFAKGYLPDWVQDWKVPYRKADMLLISTHADDEHLFFGGTMPYYAGELNLKVQLAYLTNHYNFRVHELLNGLWEVGIRAYPIISEFADYYSESLEHAKTIYEENKILEFQVELLRRFKPEVVIGHDLKGEYGHGVHMLNAEALTKALELSNDSLSYVDSAQKFGLWDVPKCYLHLYKDNNLSMNWDLPLRNFNGKTAFQMAELGFSKHVSQTEYFKVGRRGVFDCRAFGLYRSLVGEDILKNDFMENIDIQINNYDRFSYDLKY
jgi:LmbE family N-acetylglucosaminyl deacetylase